MKHVMRLHPEPFDAIKVGTKTVEMRLYDEKRQLIKIGDTISFESRKNGEILDVNVVDLQVFKSFEEIYDKFDKVSLGYREDEEANYMDMKKYYTDEDIEKYGVVAIVIAR